MTLNKMINETFEAYTLEIWEKKSEESLKGKPIASLSKNTYENILLKPLYSKEDLKINSTGQFPGQTDFRRGADPAGYLSSPWKVAQRIDAENGEELRKKLHASFERGQTAISFHLDKDIVKDFVKIIDGIYATFAFSIEAGKDQVEVLEKLSNLADCDKVSGYIGRDLLQIASNDVLKQEYDKWSEMIQSFDKRMPNLRTILVDTSVYHKAGANAIQELAAALSTGVQHIQELLERGMSLEKILSKMVFKFSIGANFFMEMAKLRAARVLWSKIAEAYGANSEEQKMVISAETSPFTKTVYDPYVNLLRAGNEAFAGVLGGVQFLHVSPFNEPEGKTTHFSDRIARNTQLILKEEAHLKNIIDPAGGSWYVESLTNELAEKAWALFLQIEEQGGMAEVLKTGWIQEQISEVMKRRNEDIFKRRQSIIGTNIYANLNDHPLQNVLESSEVNHALPNIRLSEPFEKLRKTAEKLKQSGNEPKVGLICIGELKEHKVRVDFMTGFLAPGGIQAVKSAKVDHVESALQFIQQSNLHHYVLCGTDKQYDELAQLLARLIKTNYPHVRLYLAGLPEERKQVALQQAGIVRFIHVKSNCYEILTSLLSEMEAAINE
ncbi:methylmalonyl-CoA mutase family protein [Cytobacillus sp.]|uniref:methylmalonyl-CoA mutase family protein n=1 Tax=Cytobacillus sp. TaxID=2675269 RepID=UPI0028BE7325|nr:methylmalonyl-CoA mutase family protein [Cytobacillus sp.]